MSPRTWFAFTLCAPNVSRVQTSEHFCTTSFLFLLLKPSLRSKEFSLTGGHLSFHYVKRLRLEIKILFYFIYIFFWKDKERRDERVKKQGKNAFVSRENMLCLGNYYFSQFTWSCHSSVSKVNLLCYCYLKQFPPLSLFFFLRGK